MKTGMPLVAGYGELVWLMLLTQNIGSPVP